MFTSLITTFVENLRQRRKERIVDDAPFHDQMANLNPEPFKIGDRVVRIVVPLTKRQIERVRYGVVVDVATERLTNLMYLTNRYSVRWDDTGQVEHGYLRGGLQRAKEEGR